MLRRRHLCLGPARVSCALFPRCAGNARVSYTLFPRCTFGSAACCSHVAQAAPLSQPCAGELRAGVSYTLSPRCAGGRVHGQASDWHPPGWRTGARISCRIALAGACTLCSSGAPTSRQRHGRHAVAGAPVLSTIAVAAPSPQHLRSTRRLEDSMLVEVRPCPPHECGAGLRCVKCFGDDGKAATSSIDSSSSS